ncbi:type I restriction endonuclease subunit S [Mangrovivirga cuniculi]|uniref:Type I restriction endonuclease subunit S n=1 Tax=Mangrovivirga cuniculi TaxID=2715131 RepID=A0A4D7JQV1_9BACT|nr:type I restriction endonuclease subunit S [Mangrovivirga cuniculi]
MNQNKNGKITSVFTNSATDGIVNQREYFDKDIANKKSLNNYYLVEDGDYVYNPRISVHAPVGPLSKNRLGITGAMSPLYTVFRFNDKQNSFYEYYFQTSHWYKSIKAASNTGARFDRMSITASAFMEIPVLYISLPEQQKIASCLSSLDELIATHNEKLEALKNHKKGLMQNLFPQEGQKVPNYRFPEFKNDGEWVEKKLGDAADFINGRAYKKEELLTSGKYRVLRVGNFFTNNEWYYSDLKLGEDKYCDNGDLLYAWSASFGPRIWKEEKVIYHYHIWKVVERSDIDKQFLFVLLDFETENIKTAQARGLGMQHLTKSGIESWESRIPPTKEEQQKISSSFSAIDELITAQSEKIEQLQQHKKGLMQGLFPKIDS